MTEIIKSDVLVIGSGLAGSLFSNELTNNSSYKINLISKTDIGETNTRYAQGGIAAVLSKDDQISKHVEDTLIAGAGLCRRNVAEEIISSSKLAIETLQKIGVHFDPDEASGKIALGREGGHTQRRIAHVTDKTGQAIQSALSDTITNNDKITIYENYIAIDLVNINGQIAGAYVLNQKTGIVERFSAKITILATGGVGKVFLYTSNPKIASGDGLAMAYRAGATVANMEMIQFHPTLYYNTEYHNFLLSEALRGEGAYLINSNKERFMIKQHEMAELAPRDIVSRAIDSELKQSGEDHVFLDISHKDPEFVKQRFPTIYSTTKRFGQDMTKEPIPVVPAAHYMVGGVRVKTNGQTDLKGLLALGEVSYTGFHGGNRLASNSLLEAAVMALNSSVYAKSLLDAEELQLYEFPEWETGNAVDSDEAVIVTHNWDELRRLMWSYVGIVRSTKRLLRAEKRIELLNDEVKEYYWKFKVTADVIELRNLVQVADLIVKSALFRKESRGAHFTLDYPDQIKEIRETLIQKNIGVFHSELIK